MPDESRTIKIELDAVKRGVGRPTVVDETVIQKLEEAYLIDCTDEEACLYANISEGTLYNYQKEHPEFLQRKNQLKQNLFLQARMTIAKGIKEDDTAKWYMERKKKKEFSPRTESVSMTPDDVDKELQKLEAENKTNYADIAAKAAGQMVETQQPIQGEGQAGPTGNIPAEHDPAATPSGEGITPVSTDTQS